MTDEEILALLETKPPRESLHAIRNLIGAELSKPRCLVKDPRGRWWGWCQDRWILRPPPRQTQSRGTST